MSNHLATLGSVLSVVCKQAILSSGAFVPDLCPMGLGFRTFRRKDPFNWKIHGHKDFLTHF